LISNLGFVTFCFVALSIVLVGALKPPPNPFENTKDFGGKSKQTESGRDPRFEEFLRRQEGKDRPSSRVFQQGISRNYIDLWEQHFDSKVNNKKEEWVVYFWANWSARSRRLNPIWDEFVLIAQHQYPHIKFARVNCAEEKVLCNDRLNITTLPYVVGIKKGKMTVMREDESNDGLHKFLKNGWPKRAPKAIRIPPNPNPYYLKYKRFAEGLEYVFKVPAPYIIGGTAVVISSIGLFLVYLAWQLCSEVMASSSQEQIVTKQKPKTKDSSEDRGKSNAKRKTKSKESSKLEEKATPKAKAETKKAK